MCHSDIEFKTMKNNIWSKGKFEPQYINFASWYCKGAFQKSELAGWTMAAPVILKMK